MIINGSKMFERQRAATLMKYQKRDLSNLVEKCIHDAYTKLPKCVRDEE